MNCEWVKANVALFVYDELADDAAYELEQHVARCKPCADELEQVRAFHMTMSALPEVEPTPNLLTSARMRLQESLETAPQRRAWRWALDPMAWVRQMRFSPALAAALVIVGFAAGIGTTYRFKNPPILSQNNPQLAPTEASIAGIKSITQEPNSNKVQIKYDTLMSQSAQGSLDDPKIQQLLLFAARNNYNSGVRMDSIEVLTRKPEESHIKEALLYSLRYDNNPGVRLKALEVLGPMAKDDLRVRDAVVEALVNDSNPGIRSQALHMLDPVRADSSVREVLKNLAANDKSPYIRTRSQAMLATIPEID